ncbi:hypothetical protein [Capnocytophaga granulosa]|uniref:hypothetical protein n=1 Tax=Capnocytophaga granulosa TaxID=45242 RepID=UPI0028D84855|nr:hypothetical protein [Capnocytophaga granulosa]
MKEFLRNNGLGLLAIVISVATWLSFWLRFSPFTWDSFGAITAIMGIIITFLLGIQISAIIGVRRFEKKIEEEQKEIKDTIQTIDYLRTHSLFIINHEFSMVYHEIGSSLFSYMKFALQTVEYGVSCGQITTCNSVIKAMNEVLSKSDVVFTEFEKGLLLRIYYSIKTPELIEGLDMDRFKQIGKYLMEARIK